MLYIGVDLGTTCCKACLYDHAGQVLALNSIDYPLITDGGYVEQDANIWFQAVKDNIRALIPFAKEAIGAICFSTQGISFVPVDRDGTPLSNAVTWLDSRAEAETESLKTAFGEQGIYNKTGKPLLPVYTLPKLMWFKQHSAKSYNSAYRLLMPLDFLNFKLTGRAATDLSMASGTMLYNIHTQDWDDDLLQFSGISADKLPEVIPAGTTVGNLLPLMANELGLSENVTVVMGGQDQKLAAIGAGIGEDICTVSIGTATAITKLNPGNHSASPLFAFDKGRLFAETSIATTGAVMGWLSRILGISLKEMDSLAEKAPKGSGGVQFDVDLSIGGGIKNLTLGTEKPYIIRALYEGIARECANKISEMGGTKELRVFGGGSNSTILNQILSETTGAAVCVMDTAETATLGAVMLASGGKIPCAGIRRKFTC